MFTVCPKCALTLVVTAADLRVAQGYVRCGRCLNVFNALARLSEERPATAPEPQPETAATGSPEQAASPEAPESPESLEPPESLERPESLEPFRPFSPVDDTGEIEIELDPSILVTSVRHPTAPAPESAEQPEPQSLAPVPAAPLAGPTQPAAVAISVTEARAQPTAVAPSAAQPASTGAQGTSNPAVAHERAAGKPPVQESPAQVAPAARAPGVLPERAEAPAPAAPAASAAPDAPQTNTPQQPPEHAFERDTRRPRAGIAWKLGAGALVIALALQIVNHYRDALAANPALRGPLSTVYGALGVKLAPRWNIHAYDVRQLGASVAGAAAGEIVVRASVKNSASRAQPLPLLRVTLQDRFGNRIAARDVPPGDYLPSSVAPNSLLAAGDRVDATMVFVDPGPQAVGFEIDACLRQQSGEVACAHGP